MKKQDITATPSDRRARKRLAVRQMISDTATRLFFERGFDRVTVDEIAAAADVARMTVFNHFPRKEDMFFDQDQAARDLILTVRTGDPGVAPIEALHALMHRSATEGRPYLRFFEGSRRFVETVAASEALKARARAIRDEVARSLSEEMAEAVGRPVDDPEAHLAAGLIVATLSVAFIEAHAAFRREGDPEHAKAVFLAVVDQGTAGVRAAMTGTPYTG